MPFSVMWLGHPPLVCHIGGQRWAAVTVFHKLLCLTALVLSCQVDAIEPYQATVGADQQALSPLSPLINKDVAPGNYLTSSFYYQSDVPGALTRPSLRSFELITNDIQPNKQVDFIGQARNPRDISALTVTPAGEDYDQSTYDIIDVQERLKNMSPRELDEFIFQQRLMQCRILYDEPYSAGDADEGQLYCNSTFDRVLCWPTTVAGEIAVQPCPPEFAGVKYLKYGNASKVCHDNGTWELKTDYNQCHPAYGSTDPNTIHNYIVRWLYYVGFTLSIVSCIIALFIFLYFRSLQCVRNKIHCHLIVTFVLRNLIWLVMNNVFPKIIHDETNSYQWLCKSIVALFNYAQVTNFFWMLVEGLYLHLMIVWAFSIENIKFWGYILLGWCVPAVIVFVWAMIKLQAKDNTCWLPNDDDADQISEYEYIYIAPVLLVLLINILFLISIVVVLITKLRASNTMLARQYKKAVKATVILLPLLGGTYILFICSPGEEKLVSNLIFIYFNTILQSTQGLVVTTFYCFLNGEVRATIRNRWQRWRDSRSLSTRYTRASIATTGETCTLRASFLQANNACNGRKHEANIQITEIPPTKDTSTIQETESILIHNGTVDNGDKSNGTDRHKGHSDSTNDICETSEV